MQKKITPVLKWVGGKRQLINEIEKRIPIKYNNYFEPFVGGGALFMHLQNHKAYINDCSEELIGTYEIIRDNPEELMALLDEYMINHEKGQKDYYLSVRKKDRQKNWNMMSKIQKSARMLYLNKTCYNGLYRVNSKGQFNVPFNNKKTVKLYDKVNILRLSEYLKKHTVINSGDFEVICELAQKGDFVFFDPPYDLLKEDTFDSYTKESFGTKGQIRLAETVHRLREKGCYVMITNHNTPFINDLYKNYNKSVINVKRMINSNANKRTGVETIITTY